MRLYFIIAIRNLTQARRRTLLLSLAISLVTFLLVFLLSLSRGLGETIIQSATAMASGHVNVAGWFKAKASDAWPNIQGAEAVRQIIQENTPDLDYVIARDRAWAKVISERHSLYTSPSGVDIGKEKRFRDVLQLARESEYKDGGKDVVKGDFDRLNEPKTALIFAGQAKRLGVEVGDYLTITTPTGSGRTNTIDVTVAAIAKDMGFMSNWSMFLRSQDVHDLYQIEPGSSSVLMIYLKDPGKAEEVMAQLSDVLKQKGFRIMDHEAVPFFMKFETVAGEDWTGQKLDLTIWKDEVSYLDWIVNAIDGLSFFLVGILMAIIAVGIMNSMWMSVRERTREVGTVRAIGMTRKGVLLLFLTEAALLGLLGTGVGGLVGLGLTALIDAAHFHVPFEAVQVILMSDVLHLSVSVWHVLGAMGLFTLVTALSALLPSFRASRLEPVTAIHHAG